MLQHNPLKLKSGKVGICTVMESNEKPEKMEKVWEKLGNLKILKFNTADDNECKKIC